MISQEHIERAERRWRPGSGGGWRVSGPARADFFVSYTQADRGWVE
jgi:hypothetical protein